MSKRGSTHSPPKGIAQRRIEKAQALLTAATHDGNQDVFTDAQNIMRWVHEINAAEAGDASALALHLVHGRGPADQGLRNELYRLILAAPWARSEGGRPPASNRVSEATIVTMYGMLKHGIVEVDGRRLSNQGEIVSHLCREYLLGRTKIYEVLKGHL